MLHASRCRHILSAALSIPLHSVRNWRAECFCLRVSCKYPAAPPQSGSSILSGLWAAAQVATLAVTRCRAYQTIRASFARSSLKLDMVNQATTLSVKGESLSPSPSSAPSETWTACSRHHFHQVFVPGHEIQQSLTTHYPPLCPNYAGLIPPNGNYEHQEARRRFQWRW